MKFNDLLLELKNKKPEFDIEHYGNYIVTMSKTPVKVPSLTGDKEMFVARVQHKKNKNNIQLGAGNSQGEAREAAFAKIHATDRPEDPDAFSSFTVDLNAHFSREYFDSRTGGYLKISKLGTTPVLVMASRQYFAAFGKDMESLGFRKVHIGRSKSTAGSDAAEMYNFNISKNEIKSLGLIPNMRYSLEEIEQDSDGNRMFKMIPDTRTTGRSDKYRMPGPGLTIGATEKKEDISEGAVSRRGNKLQIGSLELQLYPDHIFYVVDGGKGADLSIYKDGAFKPPRNNEIYLKDAAQRGVPQAFINLFAKFFATQDVDVVVNGLEALFKSHVKEDNLDEGKYNEIFLKGLVGAIMAGGLHLGIDYAKEKTAEYDRQGLQSVYKSIDPREYPQLVKKLTPQDQKGLNAILGKLKEHAMKMEDLTEGLKPLSVQQLATISDEALDKAYGYGRSSPGNTFGWQANLKSAEFAKRMIDKGITDIEKISDAIHQGWNVTAKAFVQNPNQFDDTAKLQAAGKLEAKLQQREKLMKIGYNQLPDDEKEKDRVVARALLTAITGQQGVAEDEKRMSRAGKGVMKYGKDGMKALAKAGRDGASDEKLDKLRDKYDKYDEGTEPDHEATMAKGQLYNACKNAMALMKMIEDDENLEGWVAAKITKASDYLNSVHDYLVYEKKSMSEEKQRLDPKCWTGYRKSGTKMKGGVRVNNCVKVKK